MQTDDDMRWWKVLEEARRVRRLAESMNDPRTIHMMLAYAEELDRKAVEQLSACAISA